MHGLADLWGKSGVRDSARFLALHEMDASLLYEIPAVQKYVQCMGHAAIGLAGAITPYPLFSNLFIENITNLVFSVFLIEIIFLIDWFLFIFSY